MTYTAPTVNYSATRTGTYTSLTGIQSVSINRGRQRFQDNFTQSILTVELIPADSYALPLAVGQFIDVRDANNGSSPCYFFGVISDVSRKFDMPYNSVSGAAPGDRITITATGPVGLIGSNSFTRSSGVQSASGGARDAAIQAGVGAIVQVFASRLASAVNFTGGALDLVNTYLRTGQFFIEDLDGQRSSSTLQQFYMQLYEAGRFNINYTFSDAGTLGAFKFAALEYLSSVQNTFTEVEVVAPAIATQTASTGVAPFNTLVYNTLSNSTADALDLANLILGLQNSVAVTPFSISTNTLLSPTCTSMSLVNYYITVGASEVVPYPGATLGSGVTVEFRGTTVEAQIQGINTTFYPDQARVQLYLSPGIGAQFILDDATFGVLDQNKLGF
jgi:hypothetical protein